MILAHALVVDGWKVLEPIPLNVGVHLFVDNQYLENVSSLEFQNGRIEKDTDHPIVHPEYSWENAALFATSFLQVPADVSVTRKPMYLVYYVCTKKDIRLIARNVSFRVANSTDANEYSIFHHAWEIIMIGFRW